MRNIGNNMAAILNVRPGEGSAVALLLIHSFFNGLAIVFFETAANSIFLAQFDARTLPYVYIASAGALAVIGLGFAGLERLLSPSRLLSFTLFFMFSATLVFYLTVLLVGSKWIVMAAMVWREVLKVIITIEFWQVAGLIFNVRQGKRLFGLVGAGEILAGVIGGFSIPYLVKVVGTPALFLVATLGVVLALVLLTHITSAFSKNFQYHVDEAGDKDNGLKVSEIFRNRYLVTFFWVAAVSLFGFYLLDYAFYDQVRARQMDQAELARFFGIFFGVLGLAKLIGSGFLTGRLLTRFGLSAGLLINPVMLILSVGTAAAFFLFNQIAVFAWLIIATKLLSELFQDSFDDPSRRILYQPLPPGQRIRVQTIVETMVEPLAVALAGGLLLFFSRLFPLTAIHVCLPVLLILAVWILVAVRLRREYTITLTRALTARRLGGLSLSLNDKQSTAVLEEKLHSPIPGEVIYCLDTLEDIEHPSLKTYFIELLDHPEPQVRQHVLSRIEHLDVTEAAEAVARRIEHEPSPRVKGAALRTLCALSNVEAFEVVSPYLEYPDPLVRKGAMVGLLRSGGADGVLTAGVDLNRLMDSLNPEDRLFMAEVLGEAGLPSLHRPLAKLLKDDDLEVRRGALKAAGRIKTLKLVPLLLYHLNLPRLRDAAFAALVQYDDKVIPELERAFADPSTPNNSRVRLARVCGKIGGDKARAMLRNNLDFPDLTVRGAVLEALAMAGFQADPEEVQDFKTMIRREAGEIVWGLAAVEDLGPDEKAAQLLAALKHEMEKGRRRLFDLLSFIEPSGSIRTAQKNLQDPSTERRARALEVLDNVVPPDVKPFIFPLFDDISPAQRFSRLSAHFPQSRRGRVERIVEIATRPADRITSWIRACALFLAGQSPVAEYLATTVEALDDPDPLVRETAVWTLGRLNPDDLMERLQPLTRDPEGAVADLARFVSESVGLAAPLMGSRVLTRTGRMSAELFANMLLDKGERRARRCRAARMLAAAGGSGAHPALLTALGIEDETIRSAVLEALVAGRVIINELDRSRFFDLLHLEMEDVRRSVSWIGLFAGDDRFQRLAQALSQELDRNRERILYILTLVNGDREADLLRYWYIRKKRVDLPEEVADRLKMLLAAVRDESLRRDVSGLFMGRPPDELARRLGLEIDRSEERVLRQLEEIAFGPPSLIRSWTRALALEAVAGLKLDDCVDRVIQLLKDVDDIVRETAVWALSTLAPEVFLSRAPGLRNDPSPMVARTVRRLVDLRQGAA